MSERGSFVTEYIYCAKCLDAAKTVLLGREKYLCSTLIPSWEPALTGRPELPIIAGKIGGLHRREEVETFDGEFRDALEPLLCHALTIAVIPDAGEPEFLRMEPRRVQNGADFSGG